ncbi:MAG: serine hydrolase [Lachnospiraceae bacterium]|nr:serine hydrolase [Lachnospiraceae bacterium]
MSDIKSTLDKIMQEEIDRGGAVGTVCLAFKDNKEIYRGVFGKDNMTDDKPIKDSSIFKLFSMTKPVTSLATMIMIERGLLKPEDYVEDYLPGFKNMKVLQADGSEVPAVSKITIQQLLSMTAGLEYPNDVTGAGLKLGQELFWPMENKYPDEMVSTVELMNRVGDYPLLYEPGTKWNYSLCADVLGAVIEVVSGVSYGEFLKKNIFEPLGMVDTGFWVQEDKYDRLVTMHDYVDGKYVPWDNPFLGTMSRKYKPAFESGGAGLTSTPDDYAKFALTLLNDGTLPAEYSKSGKPVRIISKETAEYMRTAQLNDSQRETANWYSLEGYNYGNLMRVLDNPEKAGLKGPAVGEFGWDGWAGTYVSIDPVNKIVFIYFINVTNGNREYQMKVLKNALYECLDLA